MEKGGPIDMQLAAAYVSELAAVNDSLTVISRSMFASHKPAFLLMEGPVEYQAKEVYQGPLTQFYKAWHCNRML